MSKDVTTYFRLIGDALDVDQVSRVLGRAPTATWTKGELVQGSLLARRSNAWILTVKRAGDQCDVGAHINELLDIVNPLTKRIGDLMRENDFVSEIGCTLYVSDQMPAINFEPGLVAQLAALGATVDVDIVQIAD